MYGAENFYGKSRNIVEKLVLNIFALHKIRIRAVVTSSCIWKVLHHILILPKIQKFLH